MQAPVLRTIEGVEESFNTYCISLGVNGESIVQALRLCEDFIRIQDDRSFLGDTVEADLVKILPEELPEHVVTDSFVSPEATGVYWASGRVFGGDDRHGGIDDGEEAATMVVRVEDLRSITEKIWTAFEESGIGSITIEKDHYWYVPLNAAYFLEEPPKECEMGRLSDDWNELGAFLLSREAPGQHPLIRLSSVLQGIGHELEKA